MTNVQEHAAARRGRFVAIVNLMNVAYGLVMSVLFPLSLSRQNVIVPELDSRQLEAAFIMPLLLVPTAIYMLLARSLWRNHTFAMMLYLVVTLLMMPLGVVVYLASPTMNALSSVSAILVFGINLAGVVAVSGRILNLDPVEDAETYPL